MHNELLEFNATLEGFYKPAGLTKFILIYVI